MSRIFFCSCCPYVRPFRIVFGRRAILKLPLKVGAANLPHMFVLIAFTGKELLVPLTSSMYVPGKLHDVEHVLIDVGTGYYVEKVSGREHKNASLRGRVSVQNGLPLIHFDLADS